MTEKLKVRERFRRVRTAKLFDQHRFAHSAMRIDRKAWRARRRWVVAEEAGFDIGQNCVKLPGGGSSVADFHRAYFARMAVHFLVGREIAAIFHRDRSVKVGFFLRVRT